MKDTRSDILEQGSIPDFQILPVVLQYLSAWLRPFQSIDNVPKKNSLDKWVQNRHKTITSKTTDNDLLAQGDGSKFHGLSVYWSPMRTGTLAIWFKPQKGLITYLHLGHFMYLGRNATTTRDSSQIAIDPSVTTDNKDIRDLV